MAAEVPWHRRAKPSSRGEGEPHCDRSGLDTGEEDVAECLPGVPDDVILEILARTPREATSALRGVSRAWRRAATSPLLRAVRKAQGRLEQWLFVLPALPKGGPFRAFDSQSATWHTLPPLPSVAAADLADVPRLTPQSTPGASPKDSPSGSPQRTQHPSPSHAPNYSLGRGQSPSGSPSRSRGRRDVSSDASSSDGGRNSGRSPSHSGGSSPCRSSWEGERRVHALEGFVCASVAGKLLVIGGMERVSHKDGTPSQSAVTSSVWEFDPATWEWSAAPPMGAARGWCAATVLEDRYVFVSGGQGAKAFLKSAEVYDAERREWCAIGSMRLARSSHKMAVVGGRVVAIAGEIERHDHPVPARRAEDLPFPGEIPLQTREPAIQTRQLAAPQLPAVHGAPAGNPRAGNANGIANMTAGNLPAVLRLPHQNPLAQRVHANGGPVLGPHPAAGGAGATGAGGGAGGGGWGVGGGVGGGGAMGGGNHGEPARVTPMVRGVNANASMEVYDVASDSWALVPDSWLSGNKVPCPVASVNGELYAVQHSTVQVWDPQRRMWRICGDTPGRDAQGRPFHVSGYSVVEMNNKIVLIGGCRDVWLHRTRLTQQQLSTVYAWEPTRPGWQRGGPAGGAYTDAHSDAGGDRLGAYRGGAFGAQRALQGATNGIMMWKELPPIEDGGSGHILASAVVSF